MCLSKLRRRAIFKARSSSGFVGSSHRVNVNVFHTLLTEQSASLQHPTSFLGAVACSVIRLFGQEWDESRPFFDAPRCMTYSVWEITCCAIYGCATELHLFWEACWQESRKTRRGCRKSLACANIPVQLCFGGKSVVRFDVSRRLRL